MSFFPLLEDERNYLPTLLSQNSGSEETCRVEHSGSLPDLGLHLTCVLPDLCQFRLWLQYGSQHLHWWSSHLIFSLTVFWCTGVGFNCFFCLSQAWWTCCGGCVGVGRTEGPCHTGGNVAWWCCCFMVWPCWSCLTSPQCSGSSTLMLCGTSAPYQSISFSTGLFLWNRNGEIVTLLNSTQMVPIVSLQFSDRR